MWKPHKAVIIASTIGTAVGVSFLIKDYMGGPTFKKDIRCDGKIIIVTGANTGIGKETVRELAHRGGKIIMACRDMTKCELARREIVIETQNKYVYCRKCDLSSIKSIHEFVQRFKKENNHLDILINNAGVMQCPKMLTEDGFELQLGVNHLGHFLLTNLLLDVLKIPAHSRIINVSSRAHTSGKINKDDINSDIEYSPRGAYAQSKLANILFTKELAKRLKGTNITVNCVHPGIVQTDIVRHISIIDKWYVAPFYNLFAWLFFKTPKQGAQTTLYAALEPSLNEVSGKYFCDNQEVKVADVANDMNTAKWLWLLSEKWTKLNLTQL